MKPVVAAFDFDGTLSAGVSGMRFYRQLLGQPGYAWLVVRQFPNLLCYSRRLRHEQSMAGVTRAVFRGRHASDVKRAAERFWQTALTPFLEVEPMHRLRHHLRGGHRCVIVSRGYEMYLRPWAESIGIRDVLATRLEVRSDGKLSGEMTEASCDGSVKRERLGALLGSPDEYEVYAYGDGPGDFAMLAMADHAFIRNGPGFRPWQPGGQNSCA